MWVVETAGRRDVASVLRLGVAAASLLLRHAALLQVGRWEGGGGAQGQRRLGIASVLVEGRTFTVELEYAFQARL